MRISELIDKLQCLKENAGYDIRVHTLNEFNHAQPIIDVYTGALRKKDDLSGEALGNEIIIIG